MYPVGSLVWLKQPSYPWWPCIVVNAAENGLEVPEGNDVCVLWLPSSVSSVAFAQSTNQEEIVPFNPDSENHAGFLAAEDAGEDFTSAVEEAMQILNAQQHRQDATEVAVSEPVADASTTTTTTMASKKTKEKPREHKEKKSKDRKRIDEDDDDDDDMGVLTKKSSKKEKRHRGDDHKSKKSQKKNKNRNRGSSDADDSDAEEEEFDDSDDDSSVGSANRSSKHSKKKKVDDSSRSKKPKHRREESRESEDFHQDLPPMNSNAARIAGLYDWTRKEDATDAILIDCKNRIENAKEEGDVDEQLAQLSRVSRLNVSFEQLMKVKIGASVGKLLMEPDVRVQSLANSILQYWFKELPATQKTSLTRKSDLDLASTDTIPDEETGREMARLGYLGVKVEECFTDEEIFDCTKDMDAANIATKIQAQLQDMDNDTRVSVLSALSNQGNTALRRALLSGTVSVDDLIKSANDPAALVEPQSPVAGRRSGMGGGSDAPVSPTIEGSAMDNFSTLYSCPSCGAKEATINQYSVQAHDNLAYVANCQKCGATWNGES